MLRNETYVDFYWVVSPQSCNNSLPSRAFSMVIYLDRYGNDGDVEGKEGVSVRKCRP